MGILLCNRCIEFTMFLETITKPNNFADLAERSHKHWADFFNEKDTLLL